MRPKKTCVVSPHERAVSRIIVRKLPSNIRRKKKPRFRLETRHDLSHDRSVDVIGDVEAVKFLEIIESGAGTVGDDAVGRAGMEAEVREIQLRGAHVQVRLKS